MRNDQEEELEIGSDVSIKSSNVLDDGNGSENSETEETLISIKSKEQYGLTTLRLEYSNEKVQIQDAGAANSYHEPQLKGSKDSYDEESIIDSDDEVRELILLQYGSHKDYETDKVKSHEQVTIAQEEDEFKKREEIDRTGSNDTFLSFVSTSSAEGEEETTEKKKKKHKVTGRANLKLDPHRIAAQKRKIEAKLREAVQCRSAMGMYIPPKGKRPLTKYFDSSSPGPAAYYPQQKSTKGIIMAPRWTKSIYETLGPGPGAYNPIGCLKCTAAMLNLHQSERFEKSETIGPGPGVVNISPAGNTGKDKPHAPIVPRRPRKKVGCGEGEFTNCFGLTHRGKAHPPNALIIGRYPEKDKSDPGPGAYDPEPFPDKRIGIIQKSRIPRPGPGIEPGYVALPNNMGEGPKFSIGLRHFQIENQDTPGPIYKVPVWKRKPLSLTFKPFPVRGRENDPSPMEYGNKVAEASLKVLPKAPNAMITSRKFPNFGDDLLPASNHYNLQKNLGYDGPLMKGRYKTKVEVLPGPADFVPKNSHFYNPPRAVICQDNHKEKLKENSPGFKYTPKYQHRVPGGLIVGRWKDIGELENAPDLQDLSGLTRHGPQTKIPLSLHSRHTPFKHNVISDSANPPNDDPCRTITYY